MACTISLPANVVEF